MPAGPGGLPGRTLLLSARISKWTSATTTHQCPAVSPLPLSCTQMLRSLRRKPVPWSCHTSPSPSPAKLPVLCAAGCIIAGQLTAAQCPCCSAISSRSRRAPCMRHSQPVRQHQRNQRPAKVTLPKTTTKYPKWTTKHPKCPSSADHPALLCCAVLELYCTVESAQCTAAPVVCGSWPPACFAL